MSIMAKTPDILRISEEEGINNTLFLMIHYNPKVLVGGVKCLTVQTVDRF